MCTSAPLIESLSFVSNPTANLLSLFRRRVVGRRVVGWGVVGWGVVGWGVVGWTPGGVGARGNPLSDWWGGVQLFRGGLVGWATGGVGTRGNPLSQD